MGGRIYGRVYFGSPLLPEGGTVWSSVFRAS